MHQKRKTIFVLTVTCFITIFQISLGDGSQNTCSIKQRPKLNVELLIICDKDFSDRFQQDRQLMLRFWATNLWDVNMRFKTLTSVDISFHLTSLIMTNASAAQPFIENARMSNGSIDLQHALLKFGEWIHQNEKLLSNFDIAILVTGAHVPESKTVSWQFKKSVCLKHERHKIHLSVGTISANVLFGNHCNTLEKMFAILLGAPWDSETEIYRDCRRNNFVMGKQDRCDEKQFFFSECSDAAIAFNANAYWALCLWNPWHSIVDIIDNTTSIATPPSLQEHCATLTNNSDATIVEDGKQCISTICYIPVQGSRMYAGKFYPLDNSPCGNGKLCFRGRCLEQGYAIRSTKNGACLYSSDRFASDDYLVMEPCRTSPTPLDKFIVLDQGNGVIHLATPYSSPNADENTDKCLSVKIDKQSLRYRKCLSEDQKMLEWHLVQAGNEGEFLLYHPHSKVCAYANEDNFLSVDRTCFGIDSKFIWKFVDLPTMPDAWMTSAEVLINNAKHNTVESTDLSNTKLISNKSLNKFEQCGKSSALRYWVDSCITISIGIIIGFIIGFVVSHFYRRRQKSNRNAEPASIERQYSVLYTSDST